MTAGNTKNSENVLRQPTCNPLISFAPASAPTSCAMRQTGANILIYMCSHRSKLPRQHPPLYPPRAAQASRAPDRGARLRLQEGFSASKQEEIIAAPFTTDSIAQVFRRSASIKYGHCRASHILASWVRPWPTYAPRGNFTRPENML